MLVFLFILFIILIILLAILTSKIKIDIKKINMEINLEKKIKKIKYTIILKLYIFNKIPIFKTSITPNKIEKIKQKNKIKIKELENKILTNKNKIDIEILEIIKKLVIDIKKINLEINIGTENAILTAMSVSIFSIIYSFILRKFSKEKTKQHFNIKPIYGNENFIELLFFGIFEIKMIHIINTICIVKKKRRVEKNERTSNRRSYDYSYE